jgi:membrane protein
MSTSTKDVSRAGSVPGEDADKPQEIPAQGWRQIAKRGWKEAKVDQVPLLAAGVAFYAFLAIFPAMIAGVTLYGLIADPATIAAQVGSITETLPAAARELITQQLTTLSGQKKAGFGAAVAVLLALWSASGGVSNLMTAINTAYDEEETRGFLKKRAIALALTLGALVFFLLVVTLIAVVPAVLQIFGTSGIVWFLIQAVRWILIVVLISAALAVLYRVAPDRDAPKMRWTSVGAAIATVLWIVASVGFSLYVANFGSYAKTYGAIAGIVILLLWLFITSYAILLGAEINAESEQQTIKDTTKGPEQPVGQRDAVKADTIPQPEDGSARKR